MSFLNFDITDCINETVDVVLTTSKSGSTLPSEENTIMIECYNPRKREIVAQLIAKLRQFQNPGISVLNFKTKVEIGLTIEVDRDKLTMKLDAALRETGCTTRVINKP